MEQHEIETLRDKVPCAAVLEREGWTVDVKESTTRAVKYRRGAGEIIIVIHNGRGWFDPLSDAKGDVFTLAGHLAGIAFPAAVEAVRSLVGYVPATPSWNCPKRTGIPLSITDRWRRRRPPTIGSRAWRYLADERAIPVSILQAAIAQGLLREGPSGSIWTAHVDQTRQLIGWEERGPQWRGFSTGGSKQLFRLGNEAALRLCVTEAAIDAMSLAALEGMRADTLYVSTGGGWSPVSDNAIRSIASNPDILMAAATDNDRQGEIYARRLQEIVRETGCRYERLRPSTQDWNSDLKGQGKGNPGVEGDIRAESLPHARPSRQGKLRPAGAGP
ncbi:DUF3991 and toprim domain-containing protein (plasmid) [Aminobacter sp. NyZ550]|jgi:hypothetical protein|uniref:DUF3991 and TOPRIM domain-containing protein n=1 Tax=Skermanella cutis TaxID=2775420 RepID=A0ABX7BHR7_9PROT|nr:MULTISPECIES: DUF3991 and toprim domain-containing protein [Alphaproteobacteria]MRX35938.1 DUF3991 domain-containing protein [Aminobacter sp. MDW-2]QNH38001.1 toprim domain-containing protein [Aminobacter sp. MDW-2]QOF74958.1 DUF3991 and TOPRIM domain-containing protein [Aminobacter sp. SR38]QQP93914.1 DUF3991 and TOPRIM domain-containing protein [Skermanella sp. TT6]WAX98640.1 DUF3991 and toprim domain-containing protein [Aminobacter sp. NyZ550]